jgi:hypothetical protein
MRNGRANAAWRCGVERKIVVALAVLGLMFDPDGDAYRVGIADDDGDARPGHGAAL